MPTWIILLRGVNVGGKNKLPMKAFAADLAAVGCSEVATYIQSGNAVGKAPQRSAAKLASTIGDRIEAEHGFRPGVLTMSLSAFSAVIDQNPFPDAAAEPKSLHAFFCGSKPAGGAADVLEQLRAESERFELTAKALYLHAPDGIGRSKLAAGAERALGVDATARNWRTVLALAELSSKL